MKAYLAVVLLLAFSNLAATEYRYVNYSVNDKFDNGKASFILDTLSKELRSIDVIAAVYICDNLSKFYCFSTPAISFYVPKEHIVAGKEWFANGNSFKVLRAEDIQLFGVTKAVWVIGSKRDKSESFFYYSENDGLVAIKDVSIADRHIQFFLLSEIKGFPY